jgi:photosystem II stability/assembly factor-like uncharacterized protein
MLNFISNPRHTLHSPERTSIMKLLFASLVLILFSTLSSAQSGWRYIGPVDREIQYMAVHEDLILCAASTVHGDRLFRSTDAGQSWDTLASGVRKMAIIPDGIPTILGSIPPNRDFMFSTDMGETWDTSATAPPGIWLNRLYVKRGTPNLIFAIGGFGAFGEYERLYRSSDHGRTWSWPYPFPQSSDGSKIAVGVSPTTPDVYVNVDTNIGGEYFFHSSDDGVTWEFVAESPRDITTLLIHPDVADIVYGLSGNRLIVSEDGGVSWSTIHAGNDNQRSFRSLVRSTKDANELYLFVEPNSHRGLPGIISFSDSGGLTWTDDSTSLTLPFKTVHNVFDPITWLQHDARRDRLYFQTERGIYIRENLSTAISETRVPVSRGIQVHPQPASESLTVNVNISIHAGTTLRVYSTLGKLLREWPVAATGSVHWDLRDRYNRDLPSGIYLLIAVAEKEIVTQRIVIQR